MKGVLDPLFYVLITNKGNAGGVSETTLTKTIFRWIDKK